MTDMMNQATDARMANMTVELAKRCEAAGFSVTLPAPCTLAVKGLTVTISEVMRGSFHPQRTGRISVTIGNESNGRLRVFEEKSGGQINGEQVMRELIEVATAIEMARVEADRIVDLAAAIQAITKDHDIPANIEFVNTRYSFGLNVECANPEQLLQVTLAVKAALSKNSAEYVPVLLKD